MKHIRTIGVLAVVVVMMVIGLAAFGAGAADHLEAPRVQQDGRLDINDVYAFSDGAYTTLVMTVNPGAGVVSPYTTLAGVPGESYRFLIDNDGDYVEDLIYEVRARRPNRRGIQKVAWYTIDAETNRRRLLARANSERIKNLRTGGQAYVGLRDDPFFFDLQAFRDTVGGVTGGRQFCDANAVDFFAGLNATALVLRVPSEHLTDGDQVINVWGQTHLYSEGVIDRMGKPAIATVFIPGASRDAYNTTAPADDPSLWTDEVVGVLKALGGYDDATASTIAGVLLPDVMTLDTSSSAGFLNGRGLADDVIDAELGITTNGAITGDCIDANDVPFLSEFPYLAEPN